MGTLKIELLVVYFDASFTMTFSFCEAIIETLECAIGS